MDIEDAINDRDEITLAEFADQKGITRKAAEMRADRDRVDGGNRLGVKVVQHGPRGRLMVPAAEVRRWHAERQASATMIRPGEIITLRIAADSDGSISVRVA